MLQPRKYIRFVDTDYIYANTHLDDNIDPKLVNNSINQAQDIYIQNALGYSLYTKIMNDAYDQTIAGDYYYLLNDYILPALVNWVEYMLLPYLNYKLTNKSIAERSSDSSSATTLENVEYLREDVKNHAEFLTKRITETIMNNQASFPEYFTTTGIDQIQPHRNPYFSGFDTGRGNDCCFGPNDLESVVRLNAQGKPYSTGNGLY